MADRSDLSFDAPLLYLSSNQAAWEDLEAEAFLEPPRVHGWKRPKTPDVRLMLFAGGPLLFDPGCERDPTAQQVIREGDFILRPGFEPVHPVVTGDGQRVFTKRTNFKLIKVKSFESGVVRIVYGA